MFNKLLDHIQVTLKENDTILPEIWSIDHDENKVLGVWWFRKQSGNLMFSEGGSVSHQNKEVFGDIRDKNPNEWVRGRVVKELGKVYVVVYLDPSAYSQVSSYSITNYQLNDLVNKLSKKAGSISHVIDDKGREILLEKKNVS